MENKDDDNDDSASWSIGHIVNANYIRHMVSLLPPDCVPE
jgi:hypothetical protein